MATLPPTTSGPSKIVATTPHDGQQDPTTDRMVVAQHHDEAGPVVHIPIRINQPNNDQTNDVHENKKALLSFLLAILTFLLTHSVVTGTVHDFLEDEDEDENDNNTDNGESTLHKICNNNAIRPKPPDQTVAEEIEGTTKIPHLTNTILRPQSLLAINSSSDAEWSEEEEGREMRLLKNAPVVFKDAHNEVHAAITHVDTGSPSSFISKEMVTTFGLKDHPLKDDIKTFSPLSACPALGNTEFRPTHFVVLQLKCKQLGIDEYIEARLRVLESDGFDIIFGRPFIQKHKILSKIRAIPGFDITGNPLLILKIKRTEEQVAADRKAKEAAGKKASELDRLRTSGSSSSQRTASSAASSTTSWDESLDWNKQPSSKTSWSVASKKDSAS